LQYKFWMREKNHTYKHPYHYKRWTAWCFVFDEKYPK
jgi:hypothetical protein